MLIHTHQSHVTQLYAAAVFVDDGQRSATLWTTIAIEHVIW